MGEVISHFLDSGSFSLLKVSKEYARKNRCGQWDYYDTEEFWQYIDDYAEFIKKHQIAIDLYANVDVIPNPELTWRNQKYLEEKHGLSPIPVVHYRTDLRWLERYMREGCEIIGIGGLVGSMDQAECWGWLDEVFRMVCKQPSRLPKVNLHGFGVTPHWLIVRYPWWSVDSTAWAKLGGFGRIFVPRRIGEKWNFIKNPSTITVSDDSIEFGSASRHYRAMKRMDQIVVQDWLNEIRIPIGDDNTKGVTNDHTSRRLANLFYFERLRESLPEYPWPFRVVQEKGLGVW